MKRRNAIPGGAPAHMQRRAKSAGIRLAFLFAALALFALGAGPAGDGPMGCGASTALQAQTIRYTIEVIRRVPLNGADQLGDMLADEGVSVTVKRHAVRRLAELARDLRRPENESFPAEKLYRPVIRSLERRPDVEDHHVLREEAARSLGRMHWLPDADAFIPALGRTAGDPQEHEDVRRAAAEALGLFKENARLASEALVQVLDAEIERGPSGDNVRVMTAVVASLGSLREKTAFVPLMRVVNSSFPVTVKRRAEQSLENISWE